MPSKPMFICYRLGINGNFWNFFALVIFSYCVKLVETDLLQSYKFSQISKNYTLALLLELIKQRII